MAEALQSLVDSITETLKEKYRQSGLAYWDLATKGGTAEAERAAAAEKELSLFLSDRETYAQLKEAVASPTGDALLDRQLSDLYRSYLENQLDPEEISELVDRQNELEQLFVNFRGTIDGVKLSDNQIREILVKSTDNEERRNAWEASKQIGSQVAPKLVELVNLRNQAARRLGFENFYTMRLVQSEIELTDLFGLMAELKRLTDGPYAAMKADLDGEQAVRFGIAPAQMRPWHYADPFFQEVPSGDVDTDAYFAGKSIEELSITFFDGVGMDVRDILARSDLYEREGKNQHAFCIDMDRTEDIRILCNLQPTAWWMSTMLHELGHAVYDKYVDQSLPWLLRRYAHINSTEAIAMYFGRLTRSAEWLQKIAGVPEGEADALAGALRKEESRSMLIFVRWVLVMVYFERQLYENPDQDLNSLWWKLVQEMQMVTPPAELNGAEWATKIHLGTSPVYYHNYLIGEVTASHLLAHIQHDTGSTQIVGQTGVGEWLKERFFKPGALYTWNQLVQQATGEPLSPRYFVDQFVS
jgi:peptidyl-dipeptidase A